MQTKYVDLCRRFSVYTKFTIVVISMAIVESCTFFFISAPALMLFTNVYKNTSQDEDARHRTSLHNLIS